MDKKKHTNCYLVAMPIGDDLNDISNKSLDVINRVQYVFCESLLICKRLQKNFNVNFQNKKVFELNSNEKEVKGIKLVELLIKKNIDFVMLSDSGLPAFVDRGGDIIDFLIRNYIDKVKFIPVGVSSALDVSLILLSRYVSKGFVFLHSGRHTMLFNEKDNKRMNIFLKTSLPIVLFIIYNNLDKFFDFYEKNKCTQKIFLATNLGKREISGNDNVIYKMYFGNYDEIKRKLSEINKDDDIILGLIPSKYG